MELLRYLYSINKLAIFSFIFTLLLIVFEVRLFLQEKRKKKFPQLPSFNQNLKPVFEQEKINGNNTIINNNKNKYRITHRLTHRLTPRQAIIIILIFVLISIVIIGFVTRQKDKINFQSKILIKPLSSQGIFIYNRDWKILKEEDLKNLKVGDIIYIGIKTISQDKSIDKARIKINKNNWSKDDEVQDFNEKYQIFFKKYQITSDEAKLIIEAELHSKTEGWLEGK